MKYQSLQDAFGSISSVLLGLVFGFAGFYYGGIIGWFLGMFLAIAILLIKWEIMMEIGK